jgi:hypothetical protein
VVVAVSAGDVVAEGGGGDFGVVLVGETFPDRMVDQVRLGCDQFIDASRCSS